MRLKEKKFKDKAKLNEMLDFRRQGWTYESIAVIFGVDHSSIYFWCKRKHIPAPSLPISFQEIIPRIIDEFKLPKVREKSYSDYLREEHERRYPKLYLRGSKV